MDQANRRLHGFVMQIWIELADLISMQHPFVANRLRRQADNREVVRVEQAFQLPTEFKQGIFKFTPCRYRIRPRDDQLHEARHYLLGSRTASFINIRHRPPC